MVVSRMNVGGMYPVNFVEESNPIVTVIIPAYNHEKYITECLESACNQTYQNLQIIVINDGSKDHTGEVIGKFLESSGRNIEYIEKKNEGICRTLNLGLDKTKGKYVALLASDDVWLPDKIEQQVALMENSPETGLVFGDAYFIRNTNRTTAKYSDYKPDIRNYFTDTKQNRDLYEVLMVDNIITALTVMIRTDCFDKIGKFDVSLKCEDLDMWLRISKEFKISFIDKPLAYYRIHGTNVSGSSMVMIRENAKTIFKQFRQAPLNRKPLKAARLFLLFLIKKVKNKIVKKEITA